MLAFTNVVHFLANILASLGARRFDFSRVLSNACDSLFFWTMESPRSARLGQPEVAPIKDIL